MIKALTMSLMAFSVMAASLLLLSACGGGEPALNNTQSAMSVAITDAPACGFDHVYVTIKQVRVNVSPAAGENDSGWEYITPPSPVRIDLLSLSNGLMLSLGKTLMPADNYRLMRLELMANTASTTANSIVPTGGSEQALGTLAMPTDGLSIISPVTINPDQLTEVVLDFDVCRSIVQRGDGSYALRPAISTTQMHVSGGISGYVAPELAGASVYAEINGNIIKGTRADSNGHFVLAPIAERANGGSYDVVIAHDNHATAIISGVVVDAGVSASVSTQAAPITLPASAMRNTGGHVSPVSAFATLYARQSLSGNRVFATRLVNANADTGAWTMSLPAAAPILANFGPLPLSFSTSTGDAGLYRISVMPVVGTSQNIAVDISALDANAVDASF